jgi:hypothetical protein
VRAWARLEGDAIVRPQLGIVSDEHKKKLRRKYDEMFASILARDGVFGMYSPPPRCKQKSEDEQLGSARMYTALLEYVTTPGLDGMRFALFLFNFAS